MWLIVKKILAAFGIVAIWSATWTAAQTGSGAAAVLGAFAIFGTVAGLEYIFTGTE